METGKFISLDELRKLSKNDLEFERDVIKTFVSELLNDAERANACVAKQDWEGLNIVAHKMKPTLHIIEINELLSTILKIEEYSKWKTSLDEMPKLINDLNRIAGRAAEELNMQLKKYGKSFVDVAGFLH